MADGDGDDKLDGIRDLLEAHRAGGFSRVEIERIVDDRADRKVREKLSAIGLDPDKPAETAALIGSIKNLRKGIMAFVLGIFGAAAVSAWAVISQNFPGHHP